MKTNFDRYLAEKLRNSEFKAQFEAASEAWDRLAQRERKHVVAQVKRSRREFSAGKFKEGSPEQIAREILRK